MKNILKNKLFLIILFAFIVLISFNNNTFATVDFTYNDVSYSVQDYNEINGNEGYSNHAYFIAEGVKLDNSAPNETCLYIFNYDVSEYSDIYIACNVPNWNNTTYYYTLYGTVDGVEDTKISNQSNDLLLYTLDKTTNEWVYSGPTVCFTAVAKISDLTYSSNDIYDSNSELVFQVAPQGIQIVLTPIVEQVETEKTLEEILKILPIVMIVLVSYLALRKALKMLSTFLHNS